MIVNDLREKFQRAIIVGRRPSFIYLNPTFSNPTGGIMSKQRKRDIYQAARKLGLVIVEDEPYRHIANPGYEPPPLIASLDAENQQLPPIVISVNSLSKELAPGLRSGYIACKDVTLRAKLGDILSYKVLGNNLIIQRFLVNLFDADGLVDRIIANYAKVTYERQQIMAQALRKYGADSYLTWAEPQGGLFYWVTARDPRTNMTKVRELLHQDNVEIVPGAACYPSQNEFNGPPPDHSARINFTGLRREDIDPAIERLVGCIQKELTESNSEVAIG